MPTPPPMNATQYAEFARDVLPNIRDAVLHDFDTRCSPYIACLLNAHDFLASLLDARADAPMLRTVNANHGTDCMCDDCFNIREDARSDAPASLEGKYPHSAPDRAQSIPQPTYGCVCGKSGMTAVQARAHSDGECQALYANIAMDAPAPRIAPANTLRPVAPGSAVYRTRGEG